MYVELNSECTFILNIETPLRYIEKILGKYNQHPIGVYVQGQRFPFTEENDGLYISQNGNKIDPTAPLPYGNEIDIVNSKGKLIVPSYILMNKPEMASITPLHPILVVKLLEDVLDYLQKDINPFGDLLIKNNLLPDIDDNSLITLNSRIAGNLEDLIDFAAPNIEQEDFILIDNALNKHIIDPLINILEANDTSYYRFIFDGIRIHLNKYGDIRAIRYEEALNKHNFELELKEEDACTF